MSQDANATNVNSQMSCNSDPEDLLDSNVSKFTHMLPDKLHVT